MDLKGREIELAPPSYGCAWIRGVVDTTVILVDADGTNGYFHAYSTHGNKYAGSFVTRGRGPGEYAVSPNGEKIFCALCHFNQINVYSLSGEKDFTICVSKERRLYSQEELDNTSRITRRYFYDGAVCSENYLFALYYNLPAIKHETEQNVFPVIQVFTFNGEPVAELAVRERLSDIAFDRVHNRIYGFTRDGRLLYYDLSGVGLN